MNVKFTDWYTQALGATLGILACIYSYVNGDMIIYSNMDTFFDTLGFGAIISSYLLLPLCIVALLLAIIMSFYNEGIVFNISIRGFNTLIIILTVVIGFLGASIYFIIPTAFLVFNLRDYILGKSDSEKEEKINHEKTNCIDADSIEDKFTSEKTIIFKENNKLRENSSLKKTPDVKNLSIKLQMAKELLSKNATKQFIMEVTGLTLKEIENLEKQLNSKK